MRKAFELVVGVHFDTEPTEQDEKVFTDRLLALIVAADGGSPIVMAMGDGTHPRGNAFIVTATLGAAVIPRIPLHCPKCVRQHIDQGKFAERPHHTHQCEFCGFRWEVKPYVFVASVQ